MPPTLMPSAVMDTALFSIFWKNAIPGARYHISLAGPPPPDHSSSIKWLVFGKVWPSIGATGVEDPIADAGPEWYGKIPVLGSKGVADIPGAVD